MEWKNIYRGILMGASDTIPGVSGGTIAVLLGIYDRLIAAINGIFSREWKKHLSFLIPLGIGVVIAIFSLAKLIKFLFDNYPIPTNFFFLGLILGILPHLFQQADARRKFKWKHIVLLIIGTGIVASIGFLQEAEEAVIQDFTLKTYLLLFFSGFIASAAMILPGISGAFLLLVMGAYYTVIAAISDLQLDIIIVVGFGILFGILSMSKIINFFLTNYHTGTFAMIIGLVIGSVFAIFPGWPTEMTIVGFSVATFAIGLFVAYVLGKVEYKE
ncbi:DUF368 domain-containing protein [Ornithinibacillus halophilus]|uniref:Putative membrane protein n=1 Tax=Ornithinibacillus halophilus TaxID=930117 RepID=A0A1M5IYK0_9BACI|nr:DUF368 domain-containing protein [Ornithinibacillus halophilus]SHG32823.1 putative membrane protein [Ornithinibacillus halophilus]